MLVNRAGLLRGGFASLAALVGAGLGGPFANQAKAAIAFTDVFVRNLPSADDVWAGQMLLARNSPPHTCSPGQRAFIDYLAAGLQKAGVEPRRKTFHMPFWKFQSLGLKLDGVRLPVAGVQPRSGPTAPDGVTAQIHYAGVLPNLSYVGAAGKVILIDLPPNGSRMYRFGEPFGVYPPEEHFPLDEVKAQWFNLNAPRIDAAVAAGAVGIIFVMNGVTEALAEHQEMPFGRPATLTPVLWVSEKTGRRLRAAAGSASQVNMNIAATIEPDRTSDNVWGVLPGQTDEVVIIQTHTDGCNALEDNGGILIVALAQALSRTPLARRKKTYVFLMTTGHFSGGEIEGTDDWVKEHPEILANTVTAFTIEHVGAMEWVDDTATGKSGLSGRAAWGRPVGTTKALNQGLMDAVIASDFGRVAVLNSNAAGQTGGEGNTWSTQGLPTMAYIAGEHWMFANPGVGGYVDRMSKTQVYKGLVSFARFLERIDGTSAADLRS